MIDPILDAVALPHAAGNRILNSVNKYWTEAYGRGTPKRSTSSAEQRNNLYLLADQAVAFGVPGEFVEIGCHEGQTARVIASVIEHHRADRTLHLYDDFRFGTAGEGRVRDRLQPAFRKSGLPKPVIHEGAFEHTLSTQLPQRIAFAHIDCGFGDLPEFHCQRLMRCLEALYPRMVPGSIGVLMDYHDPDRTVVGWDCNPGVKLACDNFFKKKPECIQILYGGKFSHAFFRKVW
jgi:O-methyltransferase